MSLNDFINATFELLASIAIWRNVFALYKNKGYKGIRISVSVFFTCYSAWGAYYFWTLRQTASFWCAFLAFIADVAALTLMLYYGPAEDSNSLQADFTKKQASAVETVS